MLSMAECRMKPRGTRYCISKWPYPVNLLLLLAINKLSRDLHMVPPDPCNNNYALNQSIHNNNKIALWLRLLLQITVTQHARSALLLEEQRSRAEKDFARCWSLHSMQRRWLKWKAGSQLLDDPVRSIWHCEWNRPCYVCIHLTAGNIALATYLLRLLVLWPRFGVVESRTAP